MRRFIPAAIAPAMLLGSLLSLAPAATTFAGQATPAAAATTACAPASPEEHRAVALDWLAAITDKDLGRFATLMTADTIYHAASVADTVGPDGAAAIYDGVIVGFPDLVYTPADTIADGDFVSVRYTAEGTNTGEFRGAPASGNVAAWDGIAIMRMECGRIAETWMEIDQLARALAIGTAKETPLARALTAGVHPAAAPGATPAASCAPATSREAEQAYFLWDEVWDTGDVDLLDGMFTGPAAASDANGNGIALQEDLSTLVGAWRQAMPNLQDRTEVVFAEGDLVVARWNAKGTMTGDFLGVPPTGQPVTYTGITMLRLECGRIAEEWTELDAASMLDAMGADWRA